MTLHHDDVTDSEDAAFDETVKIAGSILGVLMIAVVAFWYVHQRG